MTAPHPLDRPIWSALNSVHAHLAEGGERARRYRSEIGIFTAAADETEASLAALGALLRPGERTVALQVPEIPALDGIAMERSPGVQMWLPRRVETGADRTNIIALDERHVDEMCALAWATNPGPFMPGSLALGQFLGIRRAGRLVAMAGERMATPDFVEVSGVCVDPDFRGHGFAARLSACVAEAIQQRGQTPFLHAWQTNFGAIALYRKLGFDLRRDIHITVFSRADQTPSLSSSASTAPA